MSSWRSSGSLKLLLGTVAGLCLGAAAALFIRRAVTLPANPAKSTRRHVAVNHNSVDTTATSSITEHAHTDSKHALLNVEEQSLLQGGPRVKFTANWLGTVDELFVTHPGLRVTYEEVCAALCDQMHELERLGVTPVAPDGKVGGNCSALLQDELVSRVVVSKSGKAPHNKMDIHTDFAVIESFDMENWSCDYYACEQIVLPTSDAPLHCAVLLQTRRNMNWVEYPKVVLHGHAFETEQAANERGYPISTEETLFSTKEDTNALMELLKKFPYPHDNIYIRKGHGFVLLAKDTINSQEIFDARMKSSLAKV